jgi:sulfatase modifying factor 1
VAQKLPNAWGLYDMLGNVFEWVADWYEPQYPAGNATDPQGPASGNARSLRGDSWLYGPISARSSSRGKVEPAVRSRDFGCRCVGN